MEHPEFVRRWKAGELAVDVDRSQALVLMNTKILPGRYRAAHHFWSWIWILSIPAAFAVMYFYRWWAGLLVLVFVTPTISGATKKSTMQFMIDHSLDDATFYEYAVEKGVLRIHPKA
jgi:hypothetical protein